MEELCVGFPKEFAAEPIATHRRGRRNEKKRLTQIPLRGRSSMSRSVDSLPRQSNLNVVANQVIGSREHSMFNESNFVKSLERSYIAPQYSEKRISDDLTLPSVRPGDVLHPWSKLVSPDREPQHHLTFHESHRDESDAISELSGMESSNSMLSGMSFVSAGGRHHHRHPSKRKSHVKSQPALSRLEILENEEKDRARALKAYFDCVSEMYSLQSLQFDVDHVGTIQKDLSTNEGDVRHTIKSRILMKQLLSELKDTVVTTNHKELLPLIFTIVEDGNEQVTGPSSSISTKSVPPDAVAAPNGTSFRNVLPTASSGGYAKGGGSNVPSGFYRGRYTTKFSYKEWINSHKPRPQSQEGGDGGSPESKRRSQSGALPEKSVADKDEEMMKAINTYVEIKYIELKEKSLHRDNTPSKKKAVIAADLLLKVTNELSHHCSTLVPLVYDLLGCVFSDYRISPGTRTLTQNEYDFNKMHTYVDKFTDLCEQTEDLEIEKNWSATGVKMQQIVKKFQTVRIVFDHSARFVRDTCFNLWKSLLRRNQFYWALCRRRRMRYILKQWKAHNDAVVQAASDDETELLLPTATKEKTTKRHVHIQENDGSPEKSIGLPNPIHTGGRSSRKAGGSQPGSRRPSLDDIMKEKKRTPLKSHKSMLNINENGEASAAAIASSSILKRVGSARNALTSSEGAANTVSGATAAVVGDPKISATSKRSMSTKLSRAGSMNGGYINDLATESTESVSLSPEALQRMGSTVRPAPLLKRASASNMVMLNGVTIREATEQDVSTRSLNSNESRKFTIAELNASKRNISQRSFMSTSVHNGKIRYNVMTQTPDIWMEEVNEPVDFDGTGDSSSTIHMKVDQHHDHIAESIKISEQLISWIYGSLIPDPKQKKTQIDFKQHGSLLAYTKAYLSFKFASKRLAMKFFRILKFCLFNDSCHSKRIELFCSLCGIECGVLNHKFNMTRYEAFVGLLSCVFVNSSAFIRNTLNSPNHDIKREQVLDSVPMLLPVILRKDPELYRHIMDEIITLKPTVKTENPKEARICIDDVLALLLDYSELEANEQVHEIFPYVRTGTTQKDNKFALKQININQIHKM